ncbi:MAG TPA: YciI family protein [Opitutus sp.]|nr:YciI family protein [Opitutus sp.]
MNTPNPSHYLLLFRHPQNAPEPTPAEMERIFGQWMNWMKSMKARGQFVDANRLDDAGAVLRPLPGATVSDGPFVEAKEVVGGYVIVTAGSLAEAIEIGRGCPGIALGSTIVEVRPVEPLPSL